MTQTLPSRAHLITGGFPPGSSAGHDHDYPRLRLLGLLAEEDVQASVANDFADLPKWLPVSRLLITYVAGPCPDTAQCTALRAWLEAGGHWLALHGTSGGRAERVEGVRQRRTVKAEHHALLGSFFLTHPPICRFRVDVRDTSHPLTRGIGASFEAEDEPYFIELQDPRSTRILLTAEYGPAAVSKVVTPLYGSDTSLQADGRTRVLGYTRPVGDGAVTYFALGHCHNPAARGGRPPDPSELPTFRGSWENTAFITLLHNAIAWNTTESARAQAATASA
jgi:type 1 glutamine amidotransferase